MKSIQCIDICQPQSPKHTYLPLHSPSLPLPVVRHYRHRPSVRPPPLPPRRTDRTFGCTLRLLTASDVTLRTEPSRIFGSFLRRSAHPPLLVNHNMNVRRPDRTGQGGTHPRSSSGFGWCKRGSKCANSLRKSGSFTSEKGYGFKLACGFSLFAASRKCFTVFKCLLSRDNRSPFCFGLGNSSVAVAATSYSFNIAWSRWRLFREALRLVVLKLVVFFPPLAILAEHVLQTAILLPLLLPSRTLKPVRTYWLLYLLLRSVSYACMARGNDVRSATRPV